MVTPDPEIYALEGISEYVSDLPRRVTGSTVLDLTSLWYLGEQLPQGLLRLHRQALKHGFVLQLALSRTSQPYRRLQDWALLGRCVAELPDGSSLWELREPA